MENENNSQSWQGPYASLMMLLFALFVVLYAGSRVDADKLKKISESLKQALAHQQTTPELSAKKEASDTLVVSLDLEELKKRIEADLVLDHFAGARLKLYMDQGKLFIETTQSQVFEPGQQDPSSLDLQVLELLATSLTKHWAELKLKRELKIEGHADLDDAKILSHATSDTRFKNSWELSGARAAWLAQHWTKKMKFNPSLLSIAAYSKYRPEDQPRRRLVVVIQ